ncbi:MAG: hypothetical protein AB7V42_01470 [Thermoleophilia bacterium]
MKRTSILAGGLAVAAVLAAAASAAPGDTTVLSLDQNGQQKPAAVEAAVASANGRFVAFASAGEFTGTSTGGKTQIFVRDRQSGTTVLASSNSAGSPANDNVDGDDGVGNIQFAVSGDGRYVVFASTATNLTGADTDAGKDVFRKDLATGEVTLVSANSAGQKANAGVLGDPDVSYDGTRVAFGSGQATNLFPADGNAASDVVVRDIAAGTTTLASVSNGGEQANNTAERPAISADGGLVVFTAVSNAGTPTNLVPGGGAANMTIVRDLAAGTTTAASDPTAADGSNFPDISGDGRYVIFESGFKYDAVNDTNLANDIYRRDMRTGAITLVSAKDGSDTAGNGASQRGAVSADGSRVVYTSQSTDVSGVDTLNFDDVYVRDIGARTTSVASTASGGMAKSATNGATKGAIAGDGSLVPFIFDDAGSAVKLVATDANNQPDALGKELAPTDTTGPSLTGLSAALSGSAVTVTGAVADPSGVGALTVNGAAVRPDAAGRFTATFAGAPNTTVTVAAADGAGNVTTAAPPLAVPTTPTVLRKPRATVFTAKVVKRKIQVRVRVSATSQATFRVQRRVVKVFKKAPKRRVVFRGVGRPTVKSLTPGGTRSIALTLPKVNARFRYVLRVTLRNAEGSTTRIVTLKLPKPAPKRR